jgi:hypothetical protein
MKLKNYLTGFLAFSMVFFLAQQSSAQQLQQQTLDQIALLRQEKISRTPTEQKIDSRLLQAVRERRGQKMVAGVELEPANVNADGSGKLKVDIKADITDQFLSKIESLGGKIIFPSAEYHTVRAEVNLAMVETIADYPEVKFIQPAVLSRTVDANNLKQDAAANTKQRRAHLREQLIKYLQTHAAGSGETGTIVSEGDRTHRADDARATYGYSGEGIKVGVLSDSYNSLGSAAADVATGDLPGIGNPYGDVTPVIVVQDITGGTDEGRAMLQIVHDLAPKAQLFFATADVSEAGFATAIKQLRAAPYNCDIIMDDVGYFDEPAFQDGIVAQAVDAVTANGALYFSAAGNSGSLAKGTSGVFEGDFNDAGSAPFANGTKKGSIHNFGTVASPVNGDIITAAGEEYYDLNWSDPLGKSTNDYDLFLVNSAGTVIISSTNIQNGSQDPFEGFSEATIAAGDKLVIYKDSTAAVRALHLNTNRGTLSVATDGQTSGHPCAIAAFCMAATPAATAFGNPGSPTGPYPDAFVATNNVENFSSDGPRRIFYNPDTTAITAGNFLFGTNGGTSLAKPDLTAADGVSTTAFGEFGPLPIGFYGTSAATPHAGAIAALLKSADPSITPAQIRTLLISTALDIESAGYDNNSGNGIIQAYQAMQQLNPAAISNVILDSSSATEGSVSNHNGSIDPGESANLVAELKDISIGAATSVTGTLTTSTTGITVTQGTVSYGTIAASGGIAINTANPFVFTVASSIACGTVINLTLTINYGGGGPSPSVYPLTVTVGEQPFTNINANLGTPSSSSNFTSATGLQLGRLGRTTTAGAVCGTQQANPGLLVTTGNRTYDAYTFTNTTTVSQCVDITLSSARGDSLYSVAYNATGFVPSNPSTDFLGEPEYSSTTQTVYNYSVTVAAGQAFTVVVFEVTPATLVGAPYNLDVSLVTCAGALPVTWLGFTATPQENKEVLLQWKVTNEINTADYVAERSTDGVDFSILQTVAATTSSTSAKTYQTTDQSPVAGNNYYRIKEVDKDGNYTYSKIIMIPVNDPNVISVTPNPASSYVNITSRLLIKRIQLFSTTGQLLRDISTANNNYKLMISDLQTGQYFLRLETDNQVFNQKIIKQ